MAIIRASKTFEGGDLTQRASSYIKSGTRLVEFKNKDSGVFLFLLGAYKTDNNGNGVWYKPLRVRDQFGMGMYKEKFAVQPNCPIEYFANKVQTFAPEMAKSQETVDGEGRKRWIYPAWGRNAYRVLYNAAINGEFATGVHVLDLPMSGGGSVIDEYVKGKDMHGNDNADLTDYENAIPLNIKLDLKAKGQPWKIHIDTAKKYQLPTQLADTDYLYNLDDIVNYPSKDELIEKLKSVVPTDIFNKGMEGYSSGERTVVSMSIPAPKKTVAAPAPIVEDPVAEPDDIPMTFSNPVPNIPKANNSVAPSVNIPKSTLPKGDLPDAPNFTTPSSNSAAIKAAKAKLMEK